MLTLTRLGFLAFFRYTYVASLSLCDTGDGVLEFDETKSFATFMCTGIPSQHTVAWEVFYDRTYRLGYCPPPSSGQSTCVPQELKNLFQISRTSATQSSLSSLSGTFIADFADKMSLICRDVNTTDRGATCPLDYVYPGEGAACSAEFSSVTWSLDAECTVTKLRSVRGRYKCQLLQVNQATGDTLVLRSFNMATTPTENSNYSCGVCNMSSYLPSDGQYIYIVTVFPGNIDVTSVFKGDNRIRRPSFPPSNDCPMFVTENDTLDCTCSVSDSGIPQGLLQWNVTGSKRLLLTSVQRQQNGLMSVCSLAWNNTVLQSSYTLIVTFSSPDIPTLITDNVCSGRDKKGIYCFLQPSVKKPCGFRQKRDASTQLSFKFTNTGTDSLNVTENAEITMVCQSDGRPTPNMIISKISNNRVLASLPAGNITLAEKTGELSYTVTAVQCEDSDMYKCAADNGKGRKEQSIKLSVTCQPRRDPVYDTSTPSVIFEGPQVQVIFKLVAYPTPVVTSRTWLGPSINDRSNKKPASDGVIQADCSSNPLKIYATDCIMTINSMTSNAAGFYEVNVSNEFGSLILTFEIVLGNITESQHGALATDDYTRGLTAGIGIGVGVTVGVLVSLLVPAVCWIWRQNWVLPCAHWKDVKPVDPVALAEASDLSNDPSGHNSYDALQLTDVGAKSLYASIGADKPNTRDVTDYELPTEPQGQQQQVYRQKRTKPTAM